MKVLSLFDGISCGRVALQRAGVPVESYYASEIKPFAIRCSKENNPDIDDNIILTKSQKILDRIIFICFCEDIGLLPYKVFKQILEEAKNARFDTRETKLWERTKVLFNMIDKGYLVFNKR